MIAGQQSYRAQVNGDPPERLPTILERELA